ncbi:pantoate--beta-alanine ligase [Sphingomonas lutea]|uniref:pantoate--beta-alanine ligase n=1 Tax=Sphingomonas lutea TaxID=1045317 RepID=UPI001F15D130|nr:pantoate--beta-alanine ligase [Sphingomonas lutea]
MQIIRDLSELNLLSGQWCADDEQFALVPTMGALHDGHLALIAEAKRRAERVVATIFVNPTQFNDPADLERYPRTEEADTAKLRGAGCDAVWIPAAEDIYPHGFATIVRVAGVSERWEGEHRPGHFDGVATIVAKLLISTLPNIAVFGEKDWQQLAVIRRLEQDLQIGVDIVGVPTVREADGLALSSRNALLSDSRRAQAVALPNALADARDAISEGEPVAVALATARQSLEDAGFSKIDYIALVDAATLEPLAAPAGDMRLIAAAAIGGVRLIDNVEI